MYEEEFDLDELAQAAPDMLDYKTAYDAILKVSDKAVLIMYEGEEIWTPKSVISEIDEDTVWIKEWFAKKNGIS